MNTNNKEIVVLFEVTPTKDGKSRYLELAAMLKPLLADFDGFISAERFVNLTCGDKLLSLSIWRDERTLIQWRNQVKHRMSQMEGREKLFKNYTIRVAHVDRKYGMTDRLEAPKNSQVYFNDEK